MRPYDTDGDSSTRVDACNVMCSPACAMYRTGDTVLIPGRMSKATQKANSGASSDPSYSRQFCCVSYLERIRESCHFLRSHEAVAVITSAVDGALPFRVCGTWC